MYLIFCFMALAALAFGLAGVGVWAKNGDEFWRTVVALYSQGAMTFAAVACGLSCWNELEKPFRKG